MSNNLNDSEMDAASEITMESSTFSLREPLEISTISSSINQVSFNTSAPSIEHLCQKSVERSNRVDKVQGAIINEKMKTVSGAIAENMIQTVHQPLIVGNVNYVDMIASAILKKAREQNAAHDGHVINIVPILVQTNQPVPQQRVADTPSSTLGSEKIVRNKSTSNNDESGSQTSMYSEVLSKTTANNINKNLLSASDTVILNTPWVTEAVALSLSSSRSADDSVSKTIISSERLSLPHSEKPYALLSEVSDRVVPLESIPTEGIFNPNANQDSNKCSTEQSDTIIKSSTEEITSVSTSGNYCIANNDIAVVSRKRTRSMHHYSNQNIIQTRLSSRNNKTTDKKKRSVGNGQSAEVIWVQNEPIQSQRSPRKSKRGSLKKPTRRSPRRKSSAHDNCEDGELHISIEDQTDTDTGETVVDVAKSNSSLFREDTVILESTKTSDDAQNNQTSLSTADTVALISEDTLENEESIAFSFKSLSSFGNPSILLQSFGSKLSLDNSVLLQNEKTTLNDQQSIVPLSLITNESFGRLVSNLSSASKTESDDQFAGLKFISHESLSEIIRPQLRQTSIRSVCTEEERIQASLTSIFNHSQASTSQVLAKETQSTQTDIVLGNSSVPMRLFQVVQQTVECDPTVVEIFLQTGAQQPSETTAPSFLLSNPVPSKQSLTPIHPATDSTNVSAPKSVPHTYFQDTLNTSEHVGDSNQLVLLNFPCKKCLERFASKNELKKHMKTHVKTYQCDLCSANFTTYGNYTRHRKIHNLQTESQNLFKCDDCGREFLQRCDLKRHLLIHAKKEPYRCEKCGKGYIRRSDLVVHMRFHNKDKAFTCSVCNKGFFQTGDLSRHMRQVHHASSQLTCGHCDKKYACESTLIRHMKCVHKYIILQKVNQKLQTTEPKDSASNSNIIFAMTQKTSEYS